MVILPVELIEHILSFLHADSWERLGHLVACTTVNRLFNQITCPYLYKRIHLLPDSLEWRFDLLPLFQSLAKNPRLGRYVESFRCWDQDDDPDWLDEHHSEEAQRMALSAFKNMTEVRHLSLTPCILGEEFITTCDDMRWSSLRELHIYGASPLQYMWNPAQVSVSGSLSNLSVLRWTVDINDVQEPSQSPVFSRDGCPMLTLAIAFLGSILEVSCPLLSTLDIACSAMTLDHRSFTHEWTAILDDWMTSADWTPFQSRMDEAIGAQVPCKLTNLRSLSLPTFFEDGHRDYLIWAASYFHPQLSLITSFRLGVGNLCAQEDRQTIQLFCSAMGPNLQSLTLLSHPDDSDRNDLEPSSYGLLSSITSPSKMSFKNSLQHLAITNPGLFNHALADSLKEFSNLQSLSLNDYVEDIEDRVITNGGWLDWDPYHEFLYKFVQLLPASLEELEIVSNINTVSDPDEVYRDGKVNGPAFCRLLPNLRRFHFSLRTYSLVGNHETYPKHESYIHRLCESKANQTKRIATTYLLNHNCSSDGQDSRHRRIWNREFVVVEGKDMMFAGEDEICPWSYTQEDIDLIQRCGCEDFDLVDPDEGEEQEEEAIVLLSDLEVK